MICSKRKGLQPQQSFKVFGSGNLIRGSDTQMDVAISSGHFLDMFVWNVTGDGVTEAQVVKVE